MLSCDRRRRVYSGDWAGETPVCSRVYEHDRQLRLLLSPGIRADRRPAVLYRSVLMLSHAAGGNTDTDIGRNPDTDIEGNIDTDIGGTIDTDIGGNIDTDIGGTIDTDIGGNMLTARLSKSHAVLLGDVECCIAG